MDDLYLYALYLKDGHLSDAGVSTDQPCESAVEIVRMDPVEPTAQVRLLDRLRAEMLDECRRKFGTDTMTWDDFANAPVPRREGPAPAIGYHGHGA